MIKLSEYIITVPSFLSENECHAYIDMSEKIGYEKATVVTEKGPKLVDSVRNNFRIIHTDFSLAEMLWKRAKELVPAVIGNSYAVGFNECFRFYKYEVGQRFKKHSDESFIRNDVEASFFTFMIYLNDDNSGGETKFDDVIVKYEKGMALFFLHSLPHEGAEIKEGVKYVLRTDVMYRLAE